MNHLIMQQAGFAKESELVLQSRCPFCTKDIDPSTEFRDTLSIKEFSISGLCQACQDSIFNSPEEED